MSQNTWTKDDAKHGSEYHTHIDVKTHDKDDVQRLVRDKLVSKGVVSRDVVKEVREQERQIERNAYHEDDVARVRANVNWVNRFGEKEGIVDSLTTDAKTVNDVIENAVRELVRTFEIDGISQFDRMKVAHATDFARSWVVGSVGECTVLQTLENAERAGKELDIEHDIDVTILDAWGQVKTRSRSRISESRDDGRLNVLRNTDATAHITVRTDDGRAEGIHIWTKDRWKENDESDDMGGTNIEEML
jgi:kynurenine formamidase